MAESILHNKDTENSIRETTSNENIKLIVDVTYIVIDATNVKNKWSGEEKNRSWRVKRQLLQDVIKNIYAVSSGDAEKIAMTLYLIHSLRDLQFNGGKKTPPKDYSLNIVDDLRKYTLPLTKNNFVLHSEIEESIGKLESSIHITKTTQNWDGLLSALDNLFWNSG